MKPLFSLVLFVLSVLSLGSTACSALGAEPKPLNIAWTGGSNLTALPDRVAMERGFFEIEGLKPRYIQLQGTNLMLNALLSNEIDYVRIVPFIAGAATRGLPVKVIAALTKSGGYSIISRSDIASVKDLKGKRIAINTFGSSADFAIYQLLRRNGLDPNKDVTLLSIAGSPDARFAALIGGSADATVVNSPFEYRAEQMGFKILLGAKETAEYVKIPTSGLSTSQRKIDREPDEIVRMLRALRNAMLFLQNQRDISIGLMEKILKVDRPVAERFYAVYLEQFNPDLTVPDSVVEEWIGVGTFRGKEKIIPKPQQVVDWSFAERAKK